MQIEKNACLKPFHTFALDINCDIMVIVESLDELIRVYQNPEWRNYNKLLLGKGSNVLFTQPFKGMVIINRITGIEVSESAQAWHLHVNGGEDWPELVSWSLQQGYSGLENLAMIPGCAGSAPIQNIGAYGVEFKDVCEYVEVLDLDTLEVSRLQAPQCQFGYRDSVFKQDLYQKAVVVAVGLKLSKQWTPVVSYGNLKAIPQSELSPQRVYQEVCHTRTAKLPDPKEVGNAGSFFKNPVISTRQYNALKQSFPDMAAYPAEEGMKVAAGWLIDQCGLKGVTVGGAMVHKKQALVLINADNALPGDIIRLAQKVTDTVFGRYRIMLEHEVRFLDSDGETCLERIDIA